MRGCYEINERDRRAFYHCLLLLMRKPNEWLDMESTQLCLANCDRLLQELGYERDNCDINGWEGDMWWYFSHPTIPDIDIVLNAEAYMGTLRMAFSGIEDDVEPDTAALDVLIQNKWKKYFGG